MRKLIIVAFIERPIANRADRAMSPITPKGQSKGITIAAFKVSSVKMCQNVYPEGPTPL